MGLSEGELFDAQISSRLFRDCVTVKENLGPLSTVIHSALVVA